MDILLNAKISVFNFSMLSHWVLHCLRALALLPLWLAWWEASYLLLLTGATTWWSSCIAHYIVAAMQSLSLGDHCRKATGVRKLFLLRVSSYKIIWELSLAFWLVGLLESLICIIVLSWISLACLSFNIDWWLRPYSVFSRSWTRFLGVTSLLGNHLAIESMLLITSHVATKQIIVLLS